MNAWHISRHGLLAKNMPAGVNGGFEMDRPKTRRRRQQNDVYPAVDQLLIGIQANKALFRNDFDLIRMACFKALQTLLELLLENISHGDQQHVLVGIQRLARGARPAPAAADESDLQSVGIAFCEQIA